MSRESAIVIGGGVIGLAVADELVRRGWPTTILDRGPTGRGATWAAGGMLAPLSEVDSEPPELVTFGRDSLERFAGFVERIEASSGRQCRYLREGTLWVAPVLDDLGELDRLGSMLAERGFSAEPLGPADLTRLEPHLSRRVRGGLLLAEDHQVDPRALCRALERSLYRRGARVRAGWTADRVDVGVSGRLVVHGRRACGEPFEISTDTVVVASGAWTARDLALPCALPPVRPVKGQLLRLRGPRLVTRVVRTPDVYLIPRSDGELLIGATTEETGFDASATAGATLDLLRRAWELVPGIYDLELDEISVGLRSAVEDHLPVIGPTEVDGLFLAVGHHRNGILLAPATAHYLAEWIETGRAAPVVAAFDPARLRPRAPEESLPCR